MGERDEGEGFPGERHPALQFGGWVLRREAREWGVDALESQDRSLRARFSRNFPEISQRFSRLWRL